ncbi:MAG TPA: protein-disulfide reductase DsbD domain-containing protein [Nevskiaceae bacterium]|nr:protein-disulfide reductase DsbD domain-containing protein [Nevskiaceae bacterium]
MKRLLRPVCAALVLAVAPTHAGLLSPDPAAQPVDGILPVGQAFVPQTAIFYEGKLIVGITAAPGTYLYKAKFSVEPVDPPRYSLGSMQLPPAEKFHDEHFGDVEIYRNVIEAHFNPGGRKGPSALRINYQGCMENKVCYPPQSRVVDVMSP